MKSLTKYWWLVVALAAASVVFISYYASKNPNQHAWGIVWKPDTMQVLLTLFGGLLVSAALLDQFIEVFFPEDTDTQDERNGARSSIQIGRSIYQDHQRNISKLKREQILSKSKEKSDELKNAEEDATKHVQAIVEQKQILEDLDEKKTKKKRRIAFVIGLVIALAGIRVLTPLIEMPELNGVPNLSKYTFGHWLISYCDMIFTACLLSGGTAGVGRFFDFLKERLKQNPQP